MDNEQQVSDDFSRMAPFLVISGHDFRSKRQANLHFITRELASIGKTRFFSVGYSFLSRIKKDPRLSLWARANQVELHNGVECYLWKSLWHPVNLKKSWLRWLEKWMFRCYVRSVPALFRTWVAESSTIVLESGLPVIFCDVIQSINPSARVIYICSDALETIGCSTYLQEELKRVAPQFSGIRLPSSVLQSEFPNGCETFVIPHGMDEGNVQADTASPFGDGIHLVSVGSMLFDRSFFEVVAVAFPEYHFHIIGGGKKAEGLEGENVHVYAEMPFKETVAYLKHADVGIAPYEGEKVAPYLVDTSMKLMQFQAYGVPAVCPFIAAGNKAERFGYTPGDRDSIINAIHSALKYGRFQGVPMLSWKEVATRTLKESYSYQSKC